MQATKQATQTTAQPEVTVLRAASRPMVIVVGRSRVTISVAACWHGRLPGLARRLLAWVARRRLAVQAIARVEDQPPTAELAAAIAIGYTPSRN